MFWEKCLSKWTICVEVKAVLSLEDLLSEGDGLEGLGEKLLLDSSDRGDDLTLGGDMKRGESIGRSYTNALLQIPADGRTMD